MIKIQRPLPDDSLRKTLYEWSASPESFFALRNNFGKSLATMCIANWLLGIGDRHLQNFVIDKTNGQLIGIDFNMAFGSATRMLCVPELVPFRLTRQFVNVMKPLENSGFLVKCMAHVLRTFRIEKDSLMAAFEVFINEPTMNQECLGWGTTTDQKSLPSAIEDRAVNPEYHINTIKDKLDGINPIIPINNDLKLGYYARYASFHAKLMEIPEKFDNI